MNIPGTIKILAITTDNAQIRKLENDIARMFISPLLLMASIVSFIFRYFLLEEDLIMILIDSIVLMSTAIVLELLSRKLRNERIKEILITIIFSFVIIFIWLNFIYIVGSAVWIFSTSILLVTIFREEKFMSRIITTTIILLFILTLLFGSNTNKLDNMAYYGQMVLIMVLIINLLFIRKVIVIRSQLLTKHYVRTLKEKEKFRTTLKSVGDGVITVNQKGCIEFINPIAQKMIGLEKEEAIGEPFDDVFKIINEYTRAKLRSPIGRVLEKKKIIELANHTLLIAKDGTEIPIEDTAAPIIYENGDMSGAVIVFRDFSEKKEKQRRIEYLSYHDQLTGLYNRRFFDEEIKRLDVKRNLPISLVYADVDGLKIINDAFGHENGDKIINQTANAFKKVCRADDIIARVGGDEFIILLPNTKKQVAEKLIGRLKDRMKLINVNDIHITVSFGCSTKHEEIEVIREVLKKAEDVMYKKKILQTSSKRNLIIKSIINILHVKSPREEAHSKRVSKICGNIGKAYQLNSDDISELTIAGELHDIGKIALDEGILNKEGKLSEVEWLQIKKHPETGYRLLGSTSEFNQLAEYVLAHHERWDGHGYPKGLAGEAINWKARVIAIADSYDAMTCDRPYRKALSKDEAIVEIKKNAGLQFDPDIAKVFVEKVLGVDW